MWFTAPKGASATDWQMTSRWDNVIVLRSVKYVNIDFLSQIRPTFQLNSYQLC